MTEKNITLVIDIIIISIITLFHKGLVVWGALLSLPVILYTVTIWFAIDMCKPRGYKVKKVSCFLYCTIGAIVEGNVKLVFPNFEKEAEEIANNYDRGDEISDINAFIEILLKKGYYYKDK